MIEGTERIYVGLSRDQGSLEYGLGTLAYRFGCPIYRFIRYCLGNHECFYWFGC